MVLSLYNSLSRKKEEFTPLNENHVTMYVCGPTVYDVPHLGNARSVVIYDLLYRFLDYLYDRVTYVRNITDVDDKINKAAIDRGKPVSDITASIIKKYHEHMKALSVVTPTLEPKATDHIADVIAMIEKLIESGNAYEAEGHVLFSVETYNDYGKLSGRSVDDMIAGARIEVAPYKKDPADFVLWKPSSQELPGWESPWGRGRPGWHIECSAMSTKYLGETFDIHGGGSDLTFPHHENEVAQSICANKGSHFARYWVHNGFLMVGGEKMSKSLGNFTTVEQLLEQGVDGKIIRYALLSTHYRKPCDFSDKLLDDSKKAIHRFNQIFEDVEASENSAVKLPAEIVDALNDDLNIPKAFAYMHKLAKDKNLEELSVVLDFFGLKMEKKTKEVIDSEVLKLVEIRNLAKQNKDFAKADEIRDQLKEQGYVLEDKSGGKTEINRL